MAFFVMALLFGSSGTHEVRHNTVRFIGFSDDERMALFKIQTERHASAPEGRIIDRYTIYALYESDSNTKLADYRYGSLQRSTATGRKLQVTAKVIAENEPWANALERAPSEANFSRLKLLASKDLTITPILGFDVEQHPATNGATILTSKAPELGFIAKATRTGSALGSYRYSTSIASQVRSRVEVYSSKSGKFLTIVSRFESEGNDEPPVTYCKVVRILPGDEDYVAVRTAFGWTRMTPEQERKWIEDRERRVDDALMMDRYASGN